MNNPIKTLRMLKGFYLLTRDPNRLEQVFEIADSGENVKILQEVADHVAKEPQGKRALETMPRTGKIDLQELRKLPAGTLGREFAEHMIANNLDPAGIPVPDIGPNRTVRYVKAHLRETHDIWHVVTGFGTDVAGEIGLQAFYLAQLPSRLSAILVAMSFMHMALVNTEAREPIMPEIVRGWMIGKRAKQFFGIEWAKLWDKPLSDVRAMFDVDSALHTAELPTRQKYVFQSAA